MLDYPECPNCEGRGVVKHLDQGEAWYKDCTHCEGYGDMRINVIPVLTDRDIRELNSRENFAMSEVFGLN